MGDDEEYHIGYGVREEGDAVYYSVGGLHVVHVGEVYGGKYEVVRKLGFGQQCTVWLAKDSTYTLLRKLANSFFRTGKAVALKIIAASAGKTELENLLRIQNNTSQHPGRQHIPELLDHFQHQGSNGSHCCLVFELLGENLRTFARRLFSRNRLPPTLHKMIAKQLISALDFLHKECYFVHTGIQSS